MSKRSKAAKRPFQSFKLALRAVPRSLRDLFQRFARSGRLEHAVGVETRGALKHWNCALPLLILICLPSFAAAQSYIKYGAGSAAATNYDPSASGLGVWNVQEAIDAIVDAGLTESDTLNTVCARGCEALLVDESRKFTVGAVNKWLIYDHSTNGPQFNCLPSGGTENDCDYYRKLHNDRKFGAKDRNGAVLWDTQENTTGFFLTAKERASNPGSNPATGYWHTFFKSDGLYYMDDAGAVTGPLVPVRTQVLYFTAIDTTVNDTEYLVSEAGSSNDGQATANAFSSKHISGITGNIVEFGCQIQAAPTSTHTVAFTLATSTINANLSDSSMTFQITGASTAGSTTANPVAVTEGLFIGVKKVDSATATASQRTACWARIEA